MSGGSIIQPALIGGLVMGVLSALPIVSAGNVCCCLWVLSGGAVAAYVLQQNQPSPISQADGAIAGLLAGICGSFVYLVISIPITILMAPIERAFMERAIAMTGGMPSEFRDLLRPGSAGLRLAFSFVVMLFAGAVFSTIGGVVGSVIFRKTPPAGPAGPVDPPPIAT